MAASSPVLHYGVRLATYLRWPQLSQTTLKEGRASMAHLHAAQEGERVKVPTDDMLLGSALHVCFLEPALMLEHVALWEGDRRYGKSWDAFEADNDGKVILTRGMYTSLRGMVDSLRRHPFVREWTGGMTRTKVAAIGEVQGVMMRGRTDALTPEPLVDLKKVASADPRKVTAAVLSFGYHIQAAIYRRLFGRERFVIVCVEDSPPFDVVAYELSPAFIRAGEREALRLLAAYKACVESGEWPGRSDKVVELSPPEWIMDAEPMGPGDASNAIMLGGVDVFSET